MLFQPVEAAAYVAFAEDRKYRRGYICNRVIEFRVVDFLFWQERPVGVKGIKDGEKTLSISTVFITPNTIPSILLRKPRDTASTTLSARDPMKWITITMTMKVTRKATMPV